jgi:glycine oxidase
VSADFVIVGAGAVGLTSAIALLTEGYRVTLLERGEVGQEASWAGGGIMSPLCSWDYQDSVTRLAHRGMKMLPEAAAQLQAQTGTDPEYIQSGMLVLPPFDRAQAQAWCAQHDYPAQLIAATPYLPEQNGLLLSEVGQVRNPRLLQALRQRVVMLGGVIREQQEVLGLEVQGEQICALRTTQGDVAADAFVLTAGAWSKQLLGEHALHMEVKPIRGQILLFKFDTPPFKHILVRSGLYLIPRRDGHVLVGSTLEDVGFDKSTTVEARDDMLRKVYEILPAWRDHAPIRHWAGFRPGSPDNIPTIGRHPSITNLYANTGHFRYGVTMSLASAELLVNEIAQRPQAIPVDAYRWR